MFAGCADGSPLEPPLQLRGAETQCCYFFWQQEIVVSATPATRRRGVLFNAAAMMYVSDRHWPAASNSRAPSYIVRHRQGYGQLMEPVQLRALETAHQSPIIGRESALSNCAYLVRVPSNVMAALAQPHRDSPHDRRLSEQSHSLLESTIAELNHVIKHPDSAPPVAFLMQSYRVGF